MGIFSAFSQILSILTHVYFYRIRKGKNCSASDAGVQTDIHPLLKYEEYDHSPYVWQLQKRIAHLVRNILYILENYHSKLSVMDHRCQ